MVTRGAQSAAVYATRSPPPRRSDATLVDRRKQRQRANSSTDLRPASGAVTSTTLLHNSIYRFDDELLANTHVYGRGPVPVEGTKRAVVV
jgi:hypothetical protein